MLTAPEARADYLVNNYWKNVNFADPNYAKHSDLIEQAWVDYCDILGYVPLDVAQKAMKSTITSINRNKQNLKQITDLADKYLYDPNSPMRNEELYIPVLEGMIESALLSQTEKILPKKRLQLAHKNRINTKATDFTYTLVSGKQQTLYQTPGKYVLLFINNPGCHACLETIMQLKQLPSINRMCDKGELSILSFYPDEDLEEWKKHYNDFPIKWINSYDSNQTFQKQGLYDLKAIPTLYLLDSTKRVLLKDATPQLIEQYLSANH